ncbi:MAG: hypothetical protein H8Z69_06050 [Nanohaloarchaea archaeon]|nr:hypothetical protein [Candidatus Nanohaloarchaea archaeon]
MDFSYQEELISGVVSTVIGVAATYGVSLAIPTNDLTWALTAVGFASFFSGFFGSYYSNKE